MIAQVMQSLVARVERLEAALERIRVGCSLNENLKTGWMGRDTACEIATEALKDGP